MEKKLAINQRSGKNAQRFCRDAYEGEYWAGAGRGKRAAYSVRDLCHVGLDNMPYICVAKLITKEPTARARP